MLENLFSPHLDNLQKALGRTTERQSLLMANLANTNSPNYKRQDIDFHVALEGESSRLDALNRRMSDLRSRHGSDQTSIRQDGSNVDLEREVLSIAETELRFQALTQLTADYFAGLKNVIREGR